MQYNEGTAATGTAAAIDAARTAVTNAKAALKGTNKAYADALKTGTATAAQQTAIDDDIKDLAVAEANLDAIDGTADDTRVVSRVRVFLNASTTTDSGLGLAWTQRWNTEENSASSGLNGARFAVSMGDFSVRVGNIVGVIEATPDLYMRTASAGVGLEGNSFHSLALNNANGSFGWTAYSSGGAGAEDGVEAIYSNAGTTVHIADTAAATAFGASMKMGDISVAAAYEDVDAGGSMTLVTAGMNMGNGWVAVAHGIDKTVAAKTVSKTSLKGGYDVAPGTSVYGFVANEDAGTSSGVGLGYDLGGATFEAGYTSTAASKGILSAGIQFSF